jgi:hypothetical protein
MEKVMSPKKPPKQVDKGNEVVKTRTYKVKKKENE